jgi:hypothetical protein
MARVGIRMVCAWCRDSGNEEDRLAVLLSHGLCDRCLRELKGVWGQATRAADEPPTEFIEEARAADRRISAPLLNVRCRTVELGFFRGTLLETVEALQEALSRTVGGLVPPWNKNTNSSACPASGQITHELGAIGSSLVGSEMRNPS